MTRTALYRHFDVDGVLLYVGITDFLSERERQHAASASWFELVSKTTIEWCSCRAHALALEAVAVRYERPQFNVIHSGRPEHQPVQDPLGVELIDVVERFLDQAQMTPTAFGKHVMGDPCFVSRLRDGLDYRHSTEKRVLSFVANNQTEMSEVP